MAHLYISRKSSFPQTQSLHLPCLMLFTASVNGCEIPREWMKKQTTVKFIKLQISASQNWYCMFPCYKENYIILRQN